jgi:GNAT superfamily N-acetyltransferase
VRHATADDVAEVTRLRGLMLDHIGADVTVDDDPETGWRRRCEQRLRELLVRDDFAAFVVDAGGDVVASGAGPALAACGVGLVERRLPGPFGDGRIGYLGNMSTDPRYRRRGYARAIVTALMGWFEDRGVTRVDLHASDMGTDLYAEFGFRRPDHPELRWRAPRP